MELIAARDLIEMRERTVQHLLDVRPNNTPFVLELSGSATRKNHGGADDYPRSSREADREERGALETTRTPDRAARTSC